MASCWALAACGFLAGVVVTLAALGLLARALMRRVIAGPAPRRATKPPSQRAKELSMHVRLNPAAVSKINWTAAVGFVVAVASVFGIAIPEALQHQVLEFTALATPLAVLVLRSFFTGKPA